MNFHYGMEVREGSINISGKKAGPGNGGWGVGGVLTL